MSPPGEPVEPGPAKPWSFPAGSILESYPGGGAAISKHAHAAVFLAGVLMALRVFNHKLLLGDEGVSSLSAWRIALGQVPHRDFLEIIPPFSFLPTALAFRLFGVNLVAERLTALLWGILLLLGCDLLLSRFTSNHWIRATALCILVPFGVPFFPIPSHHWVVAVLQLFALWALAGAFRRGSIAWAGLSGVFCSLACFSLQDQGGYLVVALPLLALLWLRPVPSAVRVSLSWALGGMIAAIPFALWLLPRVPVRELIIQWVTFPAGAYMEIPGHSLGFFGGIESISAQWAPGVFRSQPFYSLTLTVTDAFILVLPILAAGAALLAYLRRWASPPLTGLLVAGSAAAFGACAHRWSLTNLTWAAPVPMVLCFWAVSQAWDSHRTWVRTVARTGCLALAISALTFAAISFRFAAPRYNAPVSAPAGTLRSNQHALAKQVQEVVLGIEANLPPGAPLATDGFMGLFNFLTLRPNPTRFNFLFHPGYHTDAHMRQAMADLERNPDAGVLLAQPLSPSRPFQVWVLSRYRPVWGNGLAVLCVPVSREPSGPVPSSGGRP